VRFARFHFLKFSHFALIALRSTHLPFSHARPRCAWTKPHRFAMLFCA
jgi:hypothetical protein